jgi:hypothetical protein
MELVEGKALRPSPPLLVAPPQHATMGCHLFFDPCGGCPTSCRTGLAIPRPPGGRLFSRRVFCGAWGSAPRTQFSPSCWATLQAPQK